MSAKTRFELTYTPQVKRHLQSIERKYHSPIRRTIETQLQFDPDVETRSREPLKRPTELGGDWEIRFGPNNRFRVFMRLTESIGKCSFLVQALRKGIAWSLVGRR